MKTHQDLEDFSQWSDTDKDQFAISIVKGLVMDATREANSGHPGGPMSCADFAFILYKHYLVFDPNDPTWFNRDRFILSGGHMSMVQYALLLFSGVLELNDIKGFRQMCIRDRDRDSEWEREWPKQRLTYVISLRIAIQKHLV